MFIQGKQIIIEKEIGLVGRCLVGCLKNLFGGLVKKLLKS